MSTSDQKALATLPSGAEIHDVLMGPIEDDLLIKNLPTLQEKYKNESSEARAERAKKYAKAIQEYDASVRSFFTSVDAVVDDYKEEAIQESKAVDTKNMERIEDKINEDSNSEI